MSKGVFGNWSDPIEFDNVPVHVSLLPNYKILYWGRRENPKVLFNDTNLNELKTSTFTWDLNSFVWDPASKLSTAKAGDKQPGKSQPTKGGQPFAADGKTTVNLFCGGHTFLGDGRLLIVGGHQWDGQGIKQACIYDYKEDKFTAQTEMNEGRWYPSALTLPDGRVMVMSGATTAGRGWYTANNISQIWAKQANEKLDPWREVINSVAPKDVDVSTRPGILSLYPRVHLTPKGRIFMAGPNAQGWFLDVKELDKDKAAKWGEADIESMEKGTSAKVLCRWVDANTKREGNYRDYCPSVMYDKGKLMYIGGGQDKNDALKIPAVGPTAAVEFIDFNDEVPKWKPGPSMKKARRQFNATILPNGTVLVTGGTSGISFNDLSKPEHTAELFDPYDTSQHPRGTWTTMAEESFDRCYHSVALLLPDGRVLSGGGGEYGPPEPWKETKDYCFPNAQFFEPPYLFKDGPRPVIKDYKEEIVYGEKIKVTLGSNEAIDKISWLRLGSVTHCRNMNQSFQWLQRIDQSGTALTVLAPDNPNVSPPGHYMLFVLNKNGMPSVGKIVRISDGKSPPAPPPPHTARMVAEHHDLLPADPAPTIQQTAEEQTASLVAERGHPPVAVGITPVCPYGLGPCWGGAYDGLNRMNDIEIVCPVAHQEDSTAHVYLQGDMLPDIDKWRREFAQTINASYDMRGIEMTFADVITKKGDQLTLAGTSTRKELPLTPFKQASQIRWDIAAKAPRPVTDVEIGAYQRLEAVLAQHPDGAKMQVTGTLQKHDVDKFSLDVRDFKVLDAAA